MLSKRHNGSAVSLWLMGIALVLPSARSTLGFAHSQDLAHRGRRGRRLSGIVSAAKQLHLPPNTILAIERHVSRARKTMKQQHQGIMKIRAELRRLMDQEHPNEQTIMNRVEQLGRKKTEKRKTRVRLLLTIRKLLTPQQRRELLKILRKRRRRHHHRKRHGGP